MDSSDVYTVFASGANELGTGNVHPRHRLDALGDAALQLERPLHLALVNAKWTLCGMPVANLHEYPVTFSDQDSNLRCPMCDVAAGHPIT